MEKKTKDLIIYLRLRFNLLPKFSVEMTNHLKHITIMYWFVQLTQTLFITELIFDTIIGYTFVPVGLIVTKCLKKSKENALSHLFQILVK